MYAWFLFSFWNSVFIQLSRKSTLLEEQPIFFSLIPSAYGGVFSTCSSSKDGSVDSGLLNQSTHSPGHRDWCWNGDGTQMESVRPKETLQGLSWQRHYIFNCASTWENTALTLLTTTQGLKTNPAQKTGNQKREDLNPDDINLVPAPTLECEDQSTPDFWVTCVNVSIMCHWEEEE